MIQFDKKSQNITLSVRLRNGQQWHIRAVRFVPFVLMLVLSGISVWNFVHYHQNGLALSYNDARSHLDIGRRVVEGLKPGLAQLGSVWLPLNHLLMIPTIWNDWMWHSGLSGAIQNMIAFVATGLILYALLKELRVGVLGRLVAAAVFTLNVNILYLQSTAMTEILLLALMTAGCYQLTRWHRSTNILDLIKSAFWIMLSTLVRYDGWFLVCYAGLLIAFHVLRKHGWKQMEGISILFFTLSGLGIALWVLWNQLIFKDPLYFILGPFSAHAQQEVMAAAGALPTRHDLLLAIKVYVYSLLYNTYTIPAIIGVFGYIAMIWDKRISWGQKLSTTALWSPLFFNILALYFGFSVIFVQGISGNTWFNIRYGIMVLPAVAVGIGYLMDRARAFRPLLFGILAFVLFFAFSNADSVTLDDARVGSSQKNVSEVAGFLYTHAANEKGFILISAASHDAIIFSSQLPMSRFIHEGTGAYWESATTGPEHWARWIVMRTYDDQDLTWKAVSRTPGFAYYDKVDSYPFADIYELQASRSGLLNTEAILGKQR